jgi:thiamine pyrophosphokinase
MTNFSYDSHSDLTKTIQELSKKGFLEFDILGIDGGSTGHILGIWGTLAESMVGLKIRLHHHDAVSYRITSEIGEFQIDMRKDQLFSVFALTRCEKIIIKGAKWELKNERLEMSTKGLHNRGNDEEIMIETDGIIVLIIEN